MPITPGSWKVNIYFGEHLFCSMQGNHLLIIYLTLDVDTIVIIKGYLKFLLTTINDLHLQKYYCQCECGYRM